MTNYLCHSRTSLPVRWLGIVLIAASIAFSAAASADDKTDIIYMKNGDRVTGEIKELRQGQLRLDSVSMGEILIKWRDVDHVESTKHIQAETMDGTRYFGPVPKSDESRVLTVETATGQEKLNHDLIVRMEPIKVQQSFWDKLDNTLNIGFTYTKASDILQWNVAASTEYRAENYQTSLSFNSNVTENTAKGLTRRGDITADYYRFRPKRFFWFGSGSMQTNDELGIDRRFLATLGYGRNVRQTQSSELLAGLGVAGNFETSIGDQTTQSKDESNLEGVVHIAWSFFKLHSPKHDVRLLLQYYPGITDSSRDRVNFDARYRQEFIKDLFWSVNFYNQYDSKPPSGAAAKDDYGIVTSLEYEF